MWPNPVKSHSIVAQGLSKALAEKGHDVTFISPFPLNKPVKNHRDITLKLDEGIHKLYEDIIQNPKKKFFWSVLKFIPIAKNIFRNMMDMPELKKLMNEEKFDLVIIGRSTNYLLGVAEHFKCPTIVLGISHQMIALNILVGNPLEVHAVRHQFVTSKNMHFCDRLKNIACYFTEILWNAFLENQQKKIFK